MFSGCQSEDSIDSPPTLSTDTDDTAGSKSNADSGPARSEKQAFAGMEFRVPVSWKVSTLSPMQMGILAAKFTTGENSEVVITLSRSSGGLDANLNRWRGQVAQNQPEVLETLTVAGAEATLIKLVGDYSPGMGRPDLPDGCLLGVIVPQPRQDYFIKATGPAASVNEMEASFREFIASAQVE